MSLLKYFAKKKDSDDNLRLPDVTWTASTTLSEKDLRSANESVKSKTSICQYVRYQEEKSTMDTPQSREHKLPNMRLRMGQPELLDISHTRRVLRIT